MNRTSVRRIAVAAITSGLMVLTACGETSSIAPIAGIAVRNATADSIAVTLIERETSYLVDPVPERAASEEGDRLIVPGGERTFDITHVSGYVPGKDLRIFLYRIRAGRSVFAGIREASNVSLRVSGYVIEVPATAFQSP